jgi:hypothetical protein
VAGSSPVRFLLEAVQCWSGPSNDMDSNLKKRMGGWDLTGEKNVLEAISSL